ncbi:hypothetical protein ACFPRL_23180 [Pseudoclavibacter helvolus]
MLSSSSVSGAPNGSRASWKASSLVTGSEVACCASTSTALPAECFLCSIRVPAVPRKFSHVR